MDERSPNIDSRRKPEIRGQKSEIRNSTKLEGDRPVAPTSTKRRTAYPQLKSSLRENVDTADDFLVPSRQF